jgi:hypothetical protein
MCDGRYHPGHVDGVIPNHIEELLEMVVTGKIQRLSRPVGAHMVWMRWVPGHRFAQPRAEFSAPVGGHLAAGTGTDFDHIGELNEMVLLRVSALSACHAGVGDDVEKIPKVRVFEHASQFAGGPGFISCRRDSLDGFEGSGGFGKGLVFHDLRVS